MFNIYRKKITKKVREIRYSEGKNFGFVEYMREIDANSAVNSFDGIIVANKRLRVRKSKRKSGMYLCVSVCLCICVQSFLHKQKKTQTHIFYLFVCCLYFGLPYLSFVMCKDEITRFLCLKNVIFLFFHFFLNIIITKHKF